MKKIIFLVGIIAILSVVLIYASNNKYRDGNYIGVSKSRYTREELYGISKLNIEKGVITKVDFKIVDSANHVVFDGSYEKRFAGNDEYIQQCRENWAAMEKFPENLIKSQDIDKVDGITGATWAYNMFKASTKEALSKAKI